MTSANKSNTPTLTNGQVLGYKQNLAIFCAMRNDIRLQNFSKLLSEFHHQGQIYQLLTDISLHVMS